MDRGGGEEEGGGASQQGEKVAAQNVGGGIRVSKIFNILFKLGLNHKMYSWVVHFLNYFISISEGDIGTERQEASHSFSSHYSMQGFVFISFHFFFLFFL